MRYAFADTELNTDTQELLHAGTTVHVEPQVLAVLEYLLAHRDRVVTKIELLDEVWGDRFVSESALTSRIKSARRVCGDTGREQRVIRTVHGRGYRLVAEVTERRGDAATAPVTPAATSTGSLVGRAAELAGLESALADAAGGRRRTVFVTGEAGVGKSALVAELIERIDEPDSWYVLRGQCLVASSGSEPYFCLLDALGRLASAHRTEIVAALDAVAPSWLAQLPSLVDADLAERLERRLLGSTAPRMLREGADAFEQLARDRPVLLVLEDLHRADECTLDVIELLTQRAEPARLLVLGTARTEAAPAQHLVAAMSAGRGATELRLSGLAASAIEAMVAARYGGTPVSRELLEIIVRRSEGIPLFAQEILAALDRSGRVAVADGAVAIQEPLDQIEAMVPDTLRQLIEQDLCGLDPRTVGLLETAAVAGVEFDGASVAAGSARPLDDVEAELSTAGRRLHHIEALGRSSWPDDTVSTRFAFTHDLYRQVLYERIPATHRARIHGAIGEAIAYAHRSTPDEVAVTLASHFVEAGDSARAVEYLRLAGEQAARRSAFSHAADFLLDALARIERLPAGPDRHRAELRVRMALGPALVATRGWFGAEVAENYERAMALCAAEGPCSEAALARYGLATVTELRGEYERTEALLLPLLEEGTGELVVETHELMACSAFHQGKFERCTECTAVVLDTWDDDQYSPLMSRLAEHPAAACSSWASLASWFLGFADESLRLAEQAVEIGEQNLYALSTARVQRAFLHQCRAEPEPCATWADATIALADEQGFPMRSIQAEMLRGWADAVNGAPEQGAARVADGLARFRTLRARLTEPYYLGLLAETRLLAGHPDGALHLLDEAITNMNETTRSFFFEPELHRLRARALVASDGPAAIAAARTELSLALDIAERLGSPPLSLRSVTDLLRLDPDHPSAPGWRRRLAALISDYAAQSDIPDVVLARELLAR